MEVMETPVGMCSKTGEMWPGGLLHCIKSAGEYQRPVTMGRLEQLKKGSLNFPIDSYNFNWIKTKKFLFLLSLHHILTERRAQQ